MTGPPMYVCWHQRRWSLLGLGSDGGPVPLEEVLALVDGQGDAAAASPAELPPAGTLVAAWGWMGRVADGTVEVEARDAAVMRLDAADLVLIDLARAPSPPGDLLSSAVQVATNDGPDDGPLRAELARRIRGLTAAGLLQGESP